MCGNCTVKIDQGKSDAFSERLVGILNDAALALMLSIGHRTGLFDALDRVGAVTSQELADACGLNERYVREWLGAMVTGRILTIDRETGRYALPSEHGAWLTRRASPDNIAVAMQFIGVLGAVEDDVVSCFERGGGVGYARFKRFHEVMAEESGQTVVAALEEHILPLVPGLRADLEAGIRVADVGCGRGRAMIELARRYPSSTFVGYDLSEEAIDWANEHARTRGLRNIEFRVQDLSEWEEPNAFDAIFAFDSIHDQKDPRHMLGAVSDALKPGGVFLAQDIAGHSDHADNLDHPVAPFIYTISCMHCMTVSLAQGGVGLGAAWGQELAGKMFEEAGFASTEVNSLAHDFMNVFYVNRN